MTATRFDFAGQVVVITGGRVFVLDIDDTGGPAVARAIRERGGQAAFVACDVTDATGVRAAFARVLDEAGRLDVLVNSAGGFWKQLSVEDTPESGRVINIGSMAGVTTLQTSSPPYAAAKAEVHSLTRVLAWELGRHGVTANAIAPGTTATERVVAVRSQQQRDEIGKGTVVGRIGEVSDMVGWILFLASPEAAYFTGQTVSVNGGRFMA